MKYFYTPLLLVIFVFSSCVTQHQLEYLQDRDKNTKTFNESNYLDYKLNPNDEVFIQISSLDEAVPNVFSANSNNLMSVGGIQPFGASLISYTITSEGFIQLPVIGRFDVKDKTIAQLTVIIKDALGRILNQPTVTIKLVNRFVSVIGEVKTPGHYSFTQDKLSVLDAIGLSGDITDYGNRKQVILIRNEKGKILRINLDLTQSSILSSEYYYLRPNDILYIKPMRNKFWGMKEFPFTMLISALTTVVLIISVTKK